jgi:TolB-like protein
MTKTILKSLVLTATAALPAAAFSFGGFAAIGKSFSKAANRAGANRVAVLPFTPLDGSDSREGRIIAENLTFDIARRGRVSLVERALLNTVMSEHRLGVSGALDRESLARIGKLVQARAVVVGTFITNGNTVEIFARLIDIENGTILAAHKSESRRSVYPALGRTGSSSSIDPMEAIMEVKLFQSGYEDEVEAAAARSLAPPRPVSPPVRTYAGLPGLRDALTHDPCAKAQERINDLEKSVLVLKARYWANQIRTHKLSASETRDKLSGKMIDPELRLTFRQTLNDAILYGAPPLNPQEIKRFIGADSEIFVLRLKCRSGRGGQR